MRHIMVDLETLDTAHTAVVLSIGAVAFECAADHLIDRALNPANFFYAELEIRDQQRARRTLSAQTVTWWMRQGEDARSLFAPAAPASTPPPRSPPSTAWCSRTRAPTTDP